MHVNIDNQIACLWFWIASMEIIGVQCVAQHYVISTLSNLHSDIVLDANTVATNVNRQKDVIIWLHSCAEAHLWSCSAGLQRPSIWSGRSSGQRFTGLSGWRLHKYRLTDLCGPKARAASCTARPKQWVGLSCGRLETSIKKYRQKLRLKLDKKNSFLYRFMNREI